MKSLLLLFSLLSTSISHAETKRQITVSGQCIKKVFPNRAALTITPTTLDRSSQSALTKTASQLEAFREQVKALNLKDLELQTTEYSVHEEQEWNPKTNRNVSKGFRARSGISVSTSEISRMGEVISVAGKLNIQDIGNLNMHLSADLAKSTNEDCLQEAVRNAKQKAEKLAAAAGAKVTKVISIDETGRGGSPEMMMDSAPVSFRAKSMNAPVDSKALDISVGVNAVFAID